jgi:hypothetical protein
MYSRRRDGNNSATTENNKSNNDGQKRYTTLSYEEIIRGIGFASAVEEEQGGNSDTNPESPAGQRTGTKESEGADKTTEQEMRELVARQIELHKNEWHVARLGDMTKNRPQGQRQ